MKTARQIVAEEGGIPKPAARPGEFIVGAAHMDHGHIFGMCGALRDAGATIKWIYDPRPEQEEDFLRSFPEAKIARSEEEILEDPQVNLVAGAAVPCERADLGIRVMNAGKDYFTDKAPLTTLDQLARAKKAVAQTGRKYLCYYGERIHSEAGVFAGYLIEQGYIGRVIQVLGLGPHRLGEGARPDWFFKKDLSGGILCDIGSHQVEQFLTYAGCKDATLVHSEIANFDHPQFPEFEDFGNASLVGDNGTSQYFRIDWFNPRGLGTWGDSRTFILGTKGYLELRKTINVGTHDGSSNHVFLVNDEGEFHFDVHHQVGYPYFRDLILDCLNRTETCMSQEHTFKAAQLGVEAEMKAVRLHPQA